MFTTRLIVGLPVAAAITFGLFVMMKGMIVGDENIEPPVYKETGIIVIGRTKDDTETIIDETLPVPEPIEEIERPNPPEPDTGEQDPDERKIGTGPERVPFIVGEPGRDVCGQPVVRVAPSYPRRAVDQGVEGYADVQFTVTVEGTVKDAVVVEQEPGTIFGSAARKAVEKWRYAPCMINGKVQEVTLVVRLTFELDNS